jgi:UPF0755 protein
MIDNPDYWKELLGDDYNEEMFSLLNDPSPKDKPSEQQTPGNIKFPTPEKQKPEDFGKSAAGSGNSDEGLEDSARFYSFDLSRGKGPIVPPGPVVPAGPAVPKGAAAKDNGPEQDSDALDRGNEDFRMNFDFDGEYRDVPEDKPIRHRREKRTGCLGGFLYAAFIICICLLLASLAWLAATDVLGLGKEDTVVQVTIPEDYDIGTVADILHKNGLIKYEFLFKIYADFSDASEKIKDGTYQLNTNFDYRALVNGMTSKGGKKVEVDVTIPEGHTLAQIFKLFDANEVCSEEELWETAANYDFDYDFLDSATLGDKHRLEGYLFPDTYTFYVGDSPTRAIDKMLSNFEKKFTDEFVTRAGEMGYTVNQIITIASMIEKEAGGDDERDTIASVIYNRLNSSNFPHLQIDATIHYAIAETGEAFSTEIDSPYNTYRAEGLPPGPISNPGINSIRAALYPEDTKYYYYALNKQGTHEFFKDGDSHSAFVNSDEYGG